MGHTRVLLRERGRPHALRGDERTMRTTFSPPCTGPTNAFESVRPRSVVADVTPPRQRDGDSGACARTAAATVPAGTVLVFNRRGMRVVGLAPRVQGAICIESRAQAQASLDKSRRIARDWRQ